MDVLNNVLQIFPTVNSFPFERLFKQAAGSHVFLVNILGVGVEEVGELSGRS